MPTRPLTHAATQSPSVRTYTRASNVPRRHPVPIGDDLHQQPTSPPVPIDPRRNRTPTQNIRPIPRARRRLVPLTTHAAVPIAHHDTSPSPSPLPPLLRVARQLGLLLRRRRSK
uniref:Uncharacterized protein n=1 Tax=Aegilops tauschii subsp. strangulata TaxID=200361 RepID=A0A453BCI2_AEGTS